MRTFLDVQGSIFNLTYLLRYWWYVDNSMRVILYLCSPTQPESMRLRCVKSGPSQIQYNYSSSYACINIQLNVSPCDWWFIDNSMRVILQICCHTQGTITGLRYVNSGPRQIKYNYSSSYTRFNIQLYVSPRRLAVYRLIGACYTPHLLSNTEHNIRFTLCHLWPRPNPIQLHFLIFRLQYSIERISTAIGSLSTNR
jgi:hypothetical protein